MNESSLSGSMYVIKSGNYITLNLLNLTSKVSHKTTFPFAATPRII